MDYIRISNLHNKLRKAYRSGEIIFVTGPMGCGKTTTIEQAFRRKTLRIFSGIGGAFREMPPMEEVEEEIIAFDDLSKLTDHASRQYIRNSLGAEGKHFILASRGSVPGWLAQVAVAREFVITDEMDVRMTDDNIQELLRNFQINNLLSEAQASNLATESSRNILCATFICRHVQKDRAYSSAAVRKGRLDMFRYADNRLFEVLSERSRRMLIRVCLFERFNSELASAVTGFDRPEAALDEILRCSSFLKIENGDEFSILDQHRQYFLWKQDNLLSAAEVEEIYRHAADYYRRKNEIKKALNCYRAAGLEEERIDYLCEIAAGDIAMEGGREIMDDYLALPEEIVRERPYLMVARSMLHSQLMNLEASKYWQEMLKDFAKRNDIDADVRQDAERMSMLLDLRLPHRGSKGMLEGITSVAEKQRGGGLPFSFVGNMPSLLNGAVDLSDFMLEQQGDVDRIAVPMRMIYRESGALILQQARAEWLFERNEIDNYDLNIVLNELLLKSQALGFEEIRFPIVTTMIRSYLNVGSFLIAESALRSLSKRTRTVHKEALDDAVEAFSVWMNLLIGELEQVKSWLRLAPDAQGANYIPDRYHYLTKARVYIAIGQLELAHAQLAQLALIFRSYKKPYMLIQTQLLEAVICHRRKDERWRAILGDALKMAQSYGYIHVVADEGAAIYPLLTEYESDEIDPEWFEQVVEEARRMQIYYPQYLKEVATLDRPLTEMERKVIRLLCNELSSDEICSMLSISYSALKFHKQNIFRKLGVRNRNDAQRKAKSLGLHLQ